jgi:hypothetical protein
MMGKHTASIIVRERGEILATVLRDVYAEVFDQIDLATATQEQLKKAFSVYAIPNCTGKWSPCLRNLLGRQDC